MENLRSVPSAESPHRTYLRALLFLLPAFVAWLFADILLLPTLESVWQKAGMAHSKPQWLMVSSDFFKNEGRLVIAAVILLFVALEYFLPTWPGYRRFTVSLIVFMLNTLVLAGLASLCTLATVAAKTLLNAP